MRKILTFLFAALMSVGMWAKNPSGSCGANLSWEFDPSNGTLTITGTGDMYDYGDDSNHAPWISSAESMTSVIISDGVTSIGEFAFVYCAGLTSVTIPNSVISIGGAAFGMCGLTSIEIPNSVTSIGDYAFAYCINLETVTINATTPPTLGSDAFESTAEGLKIYVPVGSVDTYKTAENWSDYAEKIEAIVVERVQIGDLYYNLKNDNKTAEVTSMPSGKYTGDIIIPASVDYNSVPYSVTSIGEAAFAECSGLTSVTIPEGVTSIGDAAFYLCSGLTSITIPNSVTSIGNLAFRYCSGLASVTINATTPPTLGTNAFQGTAEGLKIYVPAGSVDTYKTAWADYADKIETIVVERVLIDDLYYNLDAVIMTAEVTYKSFANFEYNEGWGITTANIPASVEYNSVTYSVTSIGERAFTGCTDLTSVTIPNSVTSIGGDAFNGCTDLTSVTIPNSVTSIGTGAFLECSGLTSVTIPNSVTSIENYAFDDCTGLTSITIPNSVTSIGKSAFYYCI